MGSEFPDEKKDAMPRAQKEIKPERIVHSSFRSYACNSLGKHGKSQMKDFFL